MEVREGYAPLARLVADRAAAARPLVVGIAGGVAVGKSTAAAAVSELFAPGQVDVVATDGFLLPNAVLVERGILHRKGFPESYDVPAVEAFLDAVHDEQTGITVPVYSHVTYDVTGDRLPIDPPDVLVLEGVNALRFADRLDVGVYLDAPEAAMQAWYVARFLELCADPPPGSFYAQFADVDLEGRQGLAADVWRSVNLPNLREHIRPTLGRADIVVVKRADHTVGRVDVVNLVP
ncbi:MAG TPA: type I pantothenate kinase [Acidimicrobiia bacterium]